MKGSCVLFLLNLKNKLVGFILAPLLMNEKVFIFTRNPKFKHPFKPFAWTLV
jgi:hypothetical protein